MLCPRCGTNVGDSIRICDNCLPPKADSAHSDRAVPAEDTEQLELEPETDFNAEPVEEYDYAGFWIRFAAYSIDAILIGIPVMVLSALVMSQYTTWIERTYLPTIRRAASEAAAQSTFSGLLVMAFLSLGLQLLIFVVAHWFYFALFESSAQGATPGKLLCGLRVARAQGGRVGFIRATARNWLKLPSLLFLYLGYLFMLVSLRRQTAHDLLSGCVVIRTNYPPLARTVALSIGAIVVGCFAQFTFDRFTKDHEARSDRFSKELKQIDQRFQWQKRMDRTTTTNPGQAAPNQPPPTPALVVKGPQEDFWRAFPDSPQGARAFIGINGKVTAAKTVVAIGYPEGSSLSFGFFPDKLTPEEIAVLKARGGVTTAVNDKRALLVLNIQLRNRAAGFSESDVLGYTATIYSDSAGGALNSVHRAVSVSRSRGKFSPTEIVDVEGEGMQSGKVTFAFRADGLATSQGQNHFRWDIAGDALL